MSNPPPQQITLNPFQMLAVTAQTLAQLQQWIESKQGTIDDSHPKHTVTAKNSIFHTRMLLNVKQQEMLKEIVAKQQQEKLNAAKKAPQGFLSEIAKGLPSIPEAYIDTEDTKQLFGKH